MSPRRRTLQAPRSTRPLASAHSVTLTRPCTWLSGSTSRMRSRSLHAQASSSASTCAAMLPWVCTTPFGRPVVPLVWSISAGRDSDAGTGSLAARAAVGAPDVDHAQVATPGRAARRPEGDAATSPRWLRRRRRRSRARERVGRVQRHGDRAGVPAPEHRHDEVATGLGEHGDASIGEVATTVAQDVGEAPRRGVELAERRRPAGIDHGTRSPPAATRATTGTFGLVTADRRRARRLR